MVTHYNHLTEADRLTLDSLLLLGHSQRHAARVLGVSPSTISREVKRSRHPGFDRYLALFGQRAYARGRKRAGRLRRKLSSNTGSPLWRLVLAGLHKGWSPEHIAGRLKLMNSPLQAQSTVRGAATRVTPSPSVTKPSPASRAWPLMSNVAPRP